jgi:hypothetical protein
MNLIVRTPSRDRLVARWLLRALTALRVPVRGHQPAGVGTADLIINHGRVIVARANR